MKVEFNKDEKTVKRIQKRLVETGGYCPCMIHKNPDTYCMCTDFRRKIEDPEFEGFCACRLYYKSKS